MTYEEAVYECDALTRKLIAACAETNAIPDERVRVAIISAALVSAGHAMDGNKMPEETWLMKRGGIAEGMATMLDVNRTPQ